MLQIYDINELVTLNLFLYHQDNHAYFVNLDNISQTILVRLPPLYVTYANVEEQCLEYHLPPRIANILQTIEHQSIQQFNINYSRSNILSTRMHPDIKVFDDKNNIQRGTHQIENTFVELILAIHGFECLFTDDNTNNIRFMYETVQVRTYDIKQPSFHVDDDNLFVSLKD